MGLAPKDEVQGMQKYSSPEFIRIYGDVQLDSNISGSEMAFWKIVPKLEILH